MWTEIFKKRNDRISLQPMGCKTLQSNSNSQEVYEALNKLKAELKEKLGTDFEKYYKL